MIDTASKAIIMTIRLMKRLLNSWTMIFWTSSSSLKSFTRLLIDFVKSMLLNATAAFVMENRKLANPLTMFSPNEDSLFVADNDTRGSREDALSFHWSNGLLRPS